MLPFTSVEVGVKAMNLHQYLGVDVEVSPQWAVPHMTLLPHQELAAFPYVHITASALCMDRQFASVIHYK